MRDLGFVNMASNPWPSAARPGLAQHDSCRPKLVVQQPALLGQPSTIPHERPVLAHHAVARKQNRQMVRGHEPADLTRMEAGGARNILVRARLAKRNSA